MNTHDVRFVLLKVQSETEWNNHMEISRRIGIIFVDGIAVFSREAGKGQQCATNPNLLDATW